MFTSDVHIDAQKLWDTSFLHTALMSSLRQNVAQSSLKTMKSKLDVFPLYFFVLAHVLTCKIGARNTYFKFALMRKKIFLSFFYA